MRSVERVWGPAPRRARGTRARSSAGLAADGFCRGLVSPVKRQRDRAIEGLVGVGNLLLACRAFHSLANSTALCHRGLRHRANKLSLAFCIRRAAAVSLLRVACWCSMSAVIPGFKDFSHWGKDVSFS